MRFKVFFKTNDRIFPVIYRHRFISFFKKALQNSGKLEMYYGNNLPKPFTFSLYIRGKFFSGLREFKLGNLTIPSQFFVLTDSTITLNFSSLYDKFGVHIINGIMDMDEFALYDGLKLLPQNIILLDEREISEDEVVFKTLSPVVLESANDKPITPQSENFVDEFNEVHERIFNSLGLGYEDVDVEVLNYKIVKVKHFVRGFHEQTGRDYMILTTFNGILRIKGKPHVLEAFYKKGIGNRTSQGFGMVDIYDE